MKDRWSNGYAVKWALVHLKLGDEDKIVLND